MFPPETLSLCIIVHNYLPSTCCSRPSTLHIHRLMQPTAQAICPLLHSTFHRDQLVETAYLLYVCIFVDSAMPDPASRDQTSQSAHLPLQNIHSIHSMHNNRCIQVFQELCSGNSYLTCIHISHPLNAVDAPHMFLSPQGPERPRNLPVHTSVLMAAGFW